MSRKEKNEMVKEAMWRKACKGSMEAAKLYREMDKEEVEKESKMPTHEELQEEIGLLNKVLKKIDKMPTIEHQLEDKKTRQAIRKELKKYKDKD